MALDGTEGDSIDLTTAAAWIANYRTTGGAVHAHFFGRDILNQILNQNGCVGIRMYYALDDDGGSRLILVGANADEDDLYQGVIGDRSYKCPPHSSHRGPLA